MSYKYDLIAFIGRFQPFHIGHLEVIQNAAKQSQRVIILIGSSDQPRTSKNPWTYQERADMIMMAINAAGINCSHILTAPLRDQSYNDQRWASDVQSIVDQVADRYGAEKIALIGHSKDSSSYYLKMFPQWDQIEHSLNEDVSATDLRKLLFEDKSLRFLAGVVPAEVLELIASFKTTPEYTVLKTEYEMIKKYKQAWEAAPYPPMFVTTDAIVVQSGHVLLIQRKAAPGAGLWAMPGGFLNQNEWIEDGVIRELREETRLKVPTPVLKGSVKHTKVFDRPDRSMRGRTITHAFLYELPPGPLPVVKGSDDAAAARWVPISEIREDEMFEDHYHIVMDMLGKL